MADLSKEVDLNMVAGEPDSNGLVWFDAAEAPFRLYGCLSANPYKRLPEDIAEATNNGVRYSFWKIMFSKV